MKSVVLISVLLIAQTNAMSWAEIFSPVQESASSLISDIVTGVRDTIDCTVLAVERVLSLDGLFETSPEYYEKCGGQSAYSSPQTSDTSRADQHFDTKKETITLNQNTYTNNQLSKDASASTRRSKAQSVIDHHDTKETIQNVHNTVTNGPESFVKISAVLKREIDKIPEAVRNKLNFNINHVSVDDVVKNIKLLYEYGSLQSEKGRAAANEVHHVFYEILSILNVTDTNVVSHLSDEEEVKMILTKMSQQPNNSRVDTDKQVLISTKARNGQVTNITNIVINVNQDSDLDTNKTYEANFKKTDAINNITEIENHTNKIINTSDILPSNNKTFHDKFHAVPANKFHAVPAKVASENRTLTTDKADLGKHHTLTNTTSTNVMHSVTSLTVHKTNTTSVEFVRNETQLSFVSPQKYQDNALETAAEMSQRRSKADPVASMLLARAGSVAEHKSEIAAPQSFTVAQSTLSAKKLQFNNDTSDTKNLSIMTNSSSVFLSSTKSSKEPLNKKLSLPLHTVVKITEPQSGPTKTELSVVLHDSNNTQSNDTSTSLLLDKTTSYFTGDNLQSKVHDDEPHINASDVSITLLSTASKNISARELHSENKVKSIASAISTKTAETGAFKTDEISDSNTTPSSMSMPDLHEGISTQQSSGEIAVTSTPAPNPGATRPTNPFPKTFRDLSQQIVSNSKTDRSQSEDYGRSVTGKSDADILEQLFGPPDKVDKQTGVQEAKNIIQSSLISQDFLDSFLSRVDANSEPSVSDNPDYSDYFSE